MIEVILALSPVTTWLLIALLLLVVELCTPGLLFFISFAFGSLFGAFAAVLGYPIVIQCCVALLVALLQFNSMRRILKRFTQEQQNATNIRALIGKTGVVVSRLRPTHAGRVKVGGEEWVASSYDTIEAGCTVEIITIEGNRLIVEPFTTQKETQ